MNEALLDRTRHRRSAGDLRDYIAADSSIHAADFIASLVTRAERLTTFPMIGRVVPEARSENIREILYRS